MTPIDLIPYAENSRKVSKKLLAPIQGPRKAPVETWKVLSAHFFDFTMAFMFSAFMAKMFDLSMKSLLVTKGLRAAYGGVDIFALSMALLPLTLFSYFFLSYFMNHGQSLGLLVQKRRLHMKASSIRDAFSWATHSFLLCFTCGISFLMKKGVWRDVKAHDHLYAELFNYKETYAMNLVEVALNNEEVEEDIRIAA